MKDPDRRFLKIAVIAFVNVYEFLWVAVSQREPAALDLDHEAMSFFKRMRYIG